MKNKYLITGFILLLSISNVSAIEDDIYDYGVYSTSSASHNAYRIHGLECNFEGSANYVTAEYTGSGADYVRPYIDCTGQSKVWGSYTYWSCNGCVQHPSTYASFNGLSDHDLIVFGCYQPDPSDMVCWHQTHTGHFYDPSEDVYTISGTTCGINESALYIHDGSDYQYLKHADLNIAGDTYSFGIVNNTQYRLIFSGGAYYDFTCTGDEVFDYDVCIYVYGYTCGIDTVKLYDDNFQLIETVNQSSGYDIYEMQILTGQEYTISFYDLGIVLCYTHSFTSGGTDIRMDFDRCNWVYPPNPPAPPIPIYVWAGYDYNIVVFRDAHGNFIENSHLAIYDKTDNKYLQRWTDAADGYTLLGAKFDTDHDVKLSLRTFDGIFTLDTTYPANGSAEVGEEDITTTNWTIPIMYNLNVLPVDQYGVTMFDVFCGLSEYTPLNPGAFWGMDLSDRGYVPVMNCSGFSMCDIIAEKDGYVDYKVEALNWTSKSALVKDYRHNIVMEEE